MLDLAVREIAVAKSRQGQDRRLSRFEDIAIRLARVIASFLATFDRIYVETWHFLSWTAQRVGSRYKTHRWPMQQLML